MNSDNRVWVLGHRIRLIDTDDSYGMVEVISPPHVPGPPPHYHKAESEFFMVIKGTLDVMSNGDWHSCPAGSFVELPPNTSHTFINNTEEDVVWITGWRPKGFQRFFKDYGVSVNEKDAQSRSMAEDVIQDVVEKVENYGMYISK
ncbi:MAG: cupin domain-containing protein [Anaerohalosphaeraceae bacterium]